jgi:hypothetical protein
MLNYFQEQFINYYDKLTEQVENYFTDDNVQNIIKNVKTFTKEQKQDVMNKLTTNMNNELFELFICSKLKIFSHKNNNTKNLSEAFFGEQLTMKQLLNNQSDEIKRTFWIYLHVLYLYASLSQPVEQRNQQHIDRLYKLLNIDPILDGEFDKDKATDKIYKLLNVDVNDDTKTMIDDIVGSFNPLLSGKETNPMTSIMQISQAISSKYANKINSGEIELDKLMESIKKKVPGMEGIIDSFNNMKSDQPPVSKEKVIIDENYSTSKVQVPEMKDSSDTSGLNIGKLLKTADSLGVLPGGSKEKSDLPNMTDMMKMLGNMSANNMPNMGNMPEMGNMPNMGNMPEMGNMPSMDVMNKMMQTPEFKHMMANLDMKHMNEMLKPSNMDKVSKQLDEMLNAK